MGRVLLENEKETSLRQLTLIKALSICRANEKSQSRMKDLHQEEQVSAIKCDRNRLWTVYRIYTDISKAK